MLIPERFDCGRLRYERIDAGNLDELRPVFLDPVMGRTLWATPQPPTDAELTVQLNRSAQHWEDHGFGPWLLRDPEIGVTVGRGGLQRKIVEGEDEIEVGWAIVPKRWNQGLATELAHTSVEVGFDELGLLRIVAFTLPHNIASRRVMEKSGFQFEREIVHVGLPHVLYARKPESKAATSSNNSGASSG
jgi:RimJ/RimL family protein N-acetyltransferase